MLEVERRQLEAVLTNTEEGILLVEEGDVEKVLLANHDMGDIVEKALESQAGHAELRKQTIVIPAAEQLPDLFFAPRLANLCSL